jgi:hypothetical protein
MNGFVLSVEGPQHSDRGLWSTHKVIGWYATEDEAVKAVPPGTEEETIVLVTDLTSGKVKRVR